MLEQTERLPVDPTTPGFFLEGIHHVQIAIPPGGEEAARGFYKQVLGLREVPVSPLVSKLAIAWFEQDTLRLHVGIDPDFHPSRRGHPAFVVRTYDDLIHHLETMGIAVTQAATVAGSRRCHIHDPFGNRIELIEKPHAGEIPG
jgi:catechol 2,3-dioxygenase-like lactoylglutathione lyase family enzyme